MNNEAFGILILYLNKKNKTNVKKVDINILKKTLSFFILLDLFIEKKIEIKNVGIKRKLTGIILLPNACFEVKKDKELVSMKIGTKLVNINKPSNRCTISLFF
jgi:hypothetical protein